MTAKKRALSSSQETKDEPVQHEAPEPENVVPTATEYIRAALVELETLGAKRTYNQVNALAYLKQAQSWLEKDNATDKSRINK